MNVEKINQQDLVDQLSARLEISKKQAEEFLKAFFPVIEETLAKSEQVKIKNFGTFKVQWNKPRKSVNVNTGEEIIIDGYNKVVFTPDESLKELVNEPFAHLFPVALDETEKEETQEAGPLRVINEQALEIKNILSEINQLNNRNAEKSEPDIKNDEQNEPELLEIEEPESVDSENNENSLTQNHASDDVYASDDIDLLPIADINVPHDEPKDSSEENEPEQHLSEYEETQSHDAEVEPAEKVSAEQSVVGSELLTAKQQTPPARKRGKFGWFLAGIATGVGLFLILYFFNLPFYRFINNTVIPFLSPSKSIPEVSILLPDTLIISEIDSAKIKEDVFYDKLLAENRTYDNIITTERFRQNSGLRKLSEKYYGHPAFWIYIYEANKENITDTSDIRRGTVLKIPAIDSLLTDTTNMRTLAIADGLKQLLFDTPAEIQTDTTVRSAEVSLQAENIQERKNTEPEFLATEIINEGSRLTLFARRYYGSKEFWVYIFEANRDVIKNPDHVMVGTEVKIPRLNPELIDKNNPECILKAKELQKKYLQN